MHNALVAFIYIETSRLLQVTNKINLAEIQFFQLLSEELFDVETSGLWSKKYGNEINWFNPENTWDESGYEMIGVLFGLALYNSVLLDVRFPLGECEAPELSFSCIHFAERSSVRFYFLAVYRKIVSLHTLKLLRRAQYLHTHIIHSSILF